MCPGSQKSSPSNLKVGGLPVHELNQLELQFLLLNDFKLVIPLDEMQRYADQLLLYGSGQTGQQTPSAGSNNSSVSSLGKGTVPRARNALDTPSEFGGPMGTPTAGPNGSSASGFTASSSAGGGGGGGRDRDGDSDMHHGAGSHS